MLLVVSCITWVHHSKQYVYCTSAPHQTMDVLDGCSTWNDVLYEHMLQFSAWNFVSFAFDWLKVCSQSGYNADDEFIKCSDVLDIWFDSGSTWASVLEGKVRLTIITTYNALVQLSLNASSPTSVVGLQTWAAGVTSTLKVTISLAAGSSRRCSPAWRCRQRRLTSKCIALSAQQHTGLSIYM